ncbi:ATP-binding domain-containing protein [Streptomyces sp. ISL-98]|uniref:ATP-binding domain-containing protein n=1 Tax=Streptomyces sp. ISL-98 TaxID=2819192 RepID=UPI001BEA976B|nr:ATP-binding domain-containing protein [Streptomyces sp. ISL-98]MBT2510432.1 ATP-binding domain-containing protein [Streptomyces sp. ISL-98]
MTALPRGETPGSPAEARDTTAATEAPDTAPEPTTAEADAEPPARSAGTAGEDAQAPAPATETPGAGTDAADADPAAQGAGDGSAGADEPAATADEHSDAGPAATNARHDPTAAGELAATAEEHGGAGQGRDEHLPSRESEDAPAQGSGAPDSEADAESVAKTGAAEGEGAAAVPQLSEAEAELAAQRALRERIEQRKAERAAPVEAGAKLSGQAADLLAAVRAVESGQKPAGAVFATPRRVAAAPAAPVQAPQTAAPAPTSADATRAVAAVLAEGGAPEALAGPVAGVLGEQAGQVLRDDPWQLLSVPGVRPEQADGFARALLGAECGPGDERRTAALVGWLLERAALQGHTALEAAAVRKALAEYKVPDPDEAVQNAIADGVVLVFQDAVADATQESQQEGEEAAGDAEAEALLGLERYALAEESLADGLARLASTFDDAAAWDTTTAPSPSAAEVIRAVAANGLVAHSGGEAARAEPAALVDVARGLGLRAYAASHSTDGRRRLAEAVEEASASVTVAGLLAGTEGPGRDEEGTLALDLLVVLDAPQLDVETAAILVESLPDGTRLVLSGDPGVLPSAGAGRVFGDLLAARACPQIVSRTPDPGPVGELVSGIGIGELNQVEAPGKEVVIVPVRDAGEAVHRTVQLVADSVPRAFGLSAGQTQVITPGHGGSAGTRALNAALKQRLNPGPGRFGGFDPGDRIAYVPAPGRTLPGAVVSADAEGLHLDCEGTPVVVPKDRVETAVRHAWALTAHQAAGMRWPAVVVVLPGDAAPALSRPWVYTAFSRAERHLSVVHGVDQALPHAVAQIPDRPRTTRLRTLLQPPAARPDPSEPDQPAS